MSIKVNVPDFLPCSVAVQCCGMLRVRSCSHWEMQHQPHCEVCRRMLYRREWNVSPTSSHSSRTPRCNSGTVNILAAVNIQGFRKCLRLLILGVEKSPGLILFLKKSIRPFFFWEKLLAPLWYFPKKYPEDDCPRPRYPINFDPNLSPPSLPHNSENPCTCPSRSSYSLLAVSKLSHSTTA